MNCQKTARLHKLFWLCVLFLALLIAVPGCNGRPDRSQNPAKKPQALPARPEANGTDSSRKKEKAQERSAVPGAGIVTGLVVNVRARSTSESERVTQVVYNDPVKILETAGDWLRVRVPDGYEGWVERQRVMPVVPDRDNGSAGQTARVIVSARTAGLFREPASSGEPLLQLVMGTGLPVLGERPAWYRVGLAGGDSAWVAAGSVKKYDPGEPGQADGQDKITGRQVVQNALRLLGVPYLWGGRTPQGIDCSGLTYLALLVEGIRIPRDAEEQFQAGRRVSRGELAPGDLVFFDTTGEGVSHVGIYAGGGRFIEASQGKKAVVITSLQDPYYRKRYLGARRYQ